MVGVYYDSNYTGKYFPRTVEQYDDEMVRKEAEKCGSL